MKVFSLVLVIGAAAIMATIGAISIFASQSLILGLLPPFLGGLSPWIAWTLSIALIIGIQVGECRPLYLSHKHTESKDLYHQGANPANTPPDVKSLLTQLMEELGLSRQKQIWVNLFAIAITIVDFIWSSILFPPFKAGNDPGAIWSALLRYGLGAINWLHVGLILANVALIPLCYLVYLNEWSILQTGQRDTATGAAPKKAESKAEPKADPKPLLASTNRTPSNPQYYDPQFTAYKSGVPTDAK